MTKRELINALEGLSDDDTVQVQVNYHTDKTEPAYHNYKESMEIVPISKVDIRDIPDDILMISRIADFHIDVKI